MSRQRDTEQVRELTLLALVVLTVVVVGAPQLVDRLRDGSLDLATLFYPVLLAAVAGLAWSRRNGG